MLTVSRPLRSSPPLWWSGLCAGIALFAAGCGPKPVCQAKDARRCVIEEVHIVQRPYEPPQEKADNKTEGDKAKKRAKDPGQLDADDVAERLATAESSLLVSKTMVDLLGERGTLLLRYERFDPLVLERDLERIQRYYRARGYYEARARAGRAIRTGDSTVAVVIDVDVGPPTILSKVELLPIDPARPLPSKPPKLREALDEAKNTLELDARFEEEKYEIAKGKIVRALTNRGYAYAKVIGRASVDLAKHEASVHFSAEAGPLCTFGEIAIEGLGDLPESKFRAVLEIRPGQRFSTEAIEASQQALANMGVLASVSVEIGRSGEGEAGAPVVPVRFLVRRAALRSIQIGGGAELGTRVQTYVVSSWEHKNFLGGLRRFSVGGRAGVVFYPLQLTNWDQPVRPLPDIRTQAELRQPGFLEERTTGSVRLEANFYRPENAYNNIDPAKQNLEANFEARGAFGLERPFWRSRVRLGTTLNTQFIAPVVVWGKELPPGFEPLFIPSIEVRAGLDLRRGADGKPDPLTPHSGIYVGAAVQGAAIFPEAGTDIRIQPDIRAYLPLSQDVTLAFRFTAGLLFPFGYGARLFDPAAACADGDAACEQRRARDVQIMLFRGFYSGGTNSNRGYGYNGVNPQEPVPSLFVDAKDAKPSPIGGRWMYGASVELRFPIYGNFGGAVFVDSSDVWNASPTGPHLSPGIGARYATPIGPARLDLGVRVPCLQRIGTCVELPLDEGGPPRPLDLPFYVAIAIGEAY